MGVACQILINKPKEGVHRAGKPINGIIKFAIDKPTDYSDVILSLLGRGRVSWSESESTDDGSRATTYTGTEEYVTRHVNVLNKAPGHVVVLPVGSYEYPFEFILPMDIPPSFRNSVCTIAYQVILRFQRPGIFSRNRTFVAEVPVYGYVYPTEPDTPIIFGLDKSLFKPFSRGNQTVNLKAEIAKAFLTPGENADVSLIVTNDSDVVIPSLKAEICSYTTYTANCGRKKRDGNRIEGCEVNTPGVQCNSIGKMSVKVPVSPAVYSIQHCRIMEKIYKVRVTVRLPMPHIDAVAEVPVVIGERVGDMTEMGIEAIEDDEQPPSYWEVMWEEKEKA